MLVSKSRSKFVVHFSQVAIVTLILFSIIRMTSDELLAAIIDFSIALVLGMNLWLLKRSDYLLFGSHVIVAFIFLLSLFIFTRGGIDATGHIPLLIFPLVTYFVLGKEQARVWIGLFTIYLFSISWLMYIGWVQPPYSMTVIRQTLIFYALILIIAYLYEKSHSHSQVQIEQQALKIQEYNYHLTQQIDQSQEALRSAQEERTQKLEAHIRDQKIQDQIYFQQMRMKTINDVLDMISDQWKEPMHMITQKRTEIESLVQAKELDRKAIKDLLKDVDSSIDNLEEVIRSFQLFYRFKNNQERICIAHSMEKVLRIMEPSLAYANIFIDLHSDESLYIYGYETEFEQVLLSLLNSSKQHLAYSGVEDGKIVIHISNKMIHEHHYAQVTIEDNGFGLLTDDLEKIFRPTIEHEERNHKLVALYMAKEIVENHINGTIDVCNYQNIVEDELITGTRYTLTLPVTEKEDKDRLSL